MAEYTFLGRFDHKIDGKKRVTIPKDFCRQLEDKRLVLVKLVNDVNNIFMKQHEKTLKYVDKLINRIGKDKVDEIIALFDSITKIAQEEKK